MGGVNVGPSTENKYAVLQVHNNAPLVADDSGFRLRFVRAKLPKQVEQGLVDCANIFSSPIPAHTPSYSVKCAKQWDSKAIMITLLHFHFHSLGSAISWKIRRADGSIFLPVNQYSKGATKTVFIVDTPIRLEKGDTIHVECTYDTSHKSTPTEFGM